MRVIGVGASARLDPTEALGSKFVRFSEVKLLDPPFASVEQLYFQQPIVSGLGAERFRLAEAFAAYNLGERLAAADSSSSSARTWAALAAAVFDGGLSPACLISFRRVSGLMRPT